MAGTHLTHAAPARAAPDSRPEAFLVHHRTFATVELVLLVAALALVVIVKAHPGPLPGDVPIALALQHWLLPHQTLTWLLEGLSSIMWPAPSIAIITAITALILLLRRWLDAAVPLATLSLADGASYLTNQIVQRPRPDGHGLYILGHITNYFSCPSGHVIHTVVYFGFLLFLTYLMRGLSPWQRLGLWPVRLALLACIVLIGPSRVLEGQHWPSDGLAGLLYGAFWLLLGIQVYGWAAHRWPRRLDAGKPTAARGAA